VYGTKANSIDEYCEFYESTTIECLKWFMQVIVVISWQMEFAHSGFVLCKPYMNNKMQKNNILQRSKKEQARMWKFVFWILQSQFATIQNPCKLWQIDTIYEIMIVCAIMHNVIIEDKKG
jgi:hypothetical protein